jgi:hypothetical protein
MLQAKEHTPTHSLSIIFTFGFTIESIKELGVATLLWPSVGVKPNTWKK